MIYTAHFEIRMGLTEFESMITASQTPHVDQATPQPHIYITTGMNYAAHQPGYVQGFTG